MSTSNPGPHTDKQTIRDAVKQARAQRDPAERAAEDAARAAALTQRLLEAEPMVVAAYLSTGTEPSLTQMIDDLTAAGVRILLPVLGPQADGSKRHFPDWAVFEGWEATREGIWHIPEPTTTPLGSRGLVVADVVVCSALGATRDGRRLGVGGGWYDRALASKREDAPVVAVLNASEIREDLPTEPWDRRVDFLATGQGIHDCSTAATQA